MFLIEFLRKVRQKPKAVRNRYAFGFASVFTATIALVWMMVILPNKQALENSQISEKKSNTSFFADLLDQSKKQMASVATFMDQEKGGVAKEIEKTLEKEKTTNIINATNTSADFVDRDRGIEKTTKENTDGNSVEKPEPILLEVAEKQDENKVSEEKATLKQGLEEVQIITTKTKKPENPDLEEGGNTPQ